jgi:Ca2+-binding RTX toxin-like protein
MATLDFTDSIPNDIDYAQIIELGTVNFFGSSISPTSGSLRFDFGGDSYFLDFVGTGMPANVTTLLFGVPTGTITSFTFRQNATVWGTGSGFNTQLVDLVNLIQAGATAEEFGNLFFSGNDTITGGSSDNLMFGLAGRDAIYGLAGNDVLDGGRDRDRLVGGSGNDTYIFDGRDVIVEGANGGLLDTVISRVDCTLAANVENLTLTGWRDATGIGNASRNTILGNTGDNSLSGGIGNDSINGGAGNDTVNGGDGSDLLIGGTGNDRFAFDSLAIAANADNIRSFSHADDTIALDLTFFGGLGGANTTLAANRFVAGAGPVGTSAQIIWNSGVSSLFYDSDGTGGNAAVLIARFSGVSPIGFDRTDIFLIA